MRSLAPDPIILERRVTALEAENLQLSERALVAEQQLARVAQLFASVSQLHQCSATADLFIIIKEVVANLLGCEEMGIFTAAFPGPVCAYCDGIGLDADRFSVLPTTHVGVRTSVIEGKLVIPADPAAEPIFGRPVHAIIPLADEDAVHGVIVLFGLLRQKKQIDAGDRDLLETLTLHAGRAYTHVQCRERTP